MNRILQAIKRYPLPLMDLARPEVLGGNLIFMYHLMVASEPLLEEAIERSPLGPIRNYYEIHITEEREHATWLSIDLSSIGVKPTMDWAAAELAGTQYYLIRHVSPTMLLGYIAALECRPIPLRVVEQLEKLHGKQLLRTVRYHAEHDIDHGPELLEFIDSLGDRNINMIAENAGRTAQALREALLELSMELSD